MHFHISLVPFIRIHRILETSTTIIICFKIYYLFQNELLLLWILPITDDQERLYREQTYWDHHRQPNVTLKAHFHNNLIFTQIVITNSYTLMRNDLCSLFTCFPSKLVFLSDFVNLSTLCCILNLKNFSYPYCIIPVFVLRIWAS
jgi:hypothetical protein